MKFLLATIFASICEHLKGTFCDMLISVPVNSVMNGIMGKNTIELYLLCLNLYLFALQ